MIILLAILFVFIVILAMNVRIVPQASAYVIDRLAARLCLWAGANYQANAEAPSVWDHVCAYHQPVCCD